MVPNASKDHEDEGGIRTYTMHWILEVVGRY